MSMTDEERFRFDLAGFLVRPAILTADEVKEIREQIYLIKHDPESLPPEHRDVPGGPSSVLIDHPAVVDVISEIISPDFRLENCTCVWRNKGEEHGELHGGGPNQIDPIFGYRVQRERIYAGMVRVIFEFTDIGLEDQSTHFVAGSHKANFPMHPDHMSLEPGKRSEFLMSYACPAGSAVFFTENTCHAGPPWNRDEPRVTVPQRLFSPCDPLAPAQDSTGRHCGPSAREAGLFSRDVDSRFPVIAGHDEHGRTIPWQRRTTGQLGHEAPSRTFLTRKWMEFRQMLLIEKSVNEGSGFKPGEETILFVVVSYPSR